MDIDAARTALNKALSGKTLTDVRYFIKQALSYLQTTPSVTCPQCGKTSYHPQDIEYGYCGHCHMFHADMAVVVCGVCKRDMSPKPGAILQCDNDLCPFWRAAL